MQTMRTIIWAVLAAGLAIFAFANWAPVEVTIWPGYTAETWLPVIIIGSFLIGFLPAFLVYSATRWRSRKTIEQQAQIIADLRTAPVVPAAVTQPQVVHTPIDADPVTGTSDSLPPDRTTGL